MRDQLNQIRSKRLFIILSLFFLAMTISLTVVQSTKQQNLRSNAASDITNCTISDTLIANDDEETKMLDLINNYRAQNNLPAYSFQQDLNRAAAWQSKDMAGRNTMDHTDSLGRNPQQRMVDCGYKQYQHTVENIATGPGTAQDIFTAWKNSPEHNANMLCSDCTDVGIARDQQGTNGNWYWTMDAGVLLPTNSLNPTMSTTVTTSPSASPTISAKPTNTANLPAATPEVTLPPAHTQLPEGTTGISLTVFLYGIDIVYSKPPVHPNRPITVTVSTPDNKAVATANGIISFDPSSYTFKGAIALPDTLESGTYIVKVKTDHSLAKIVNSGYVKLEKGKTTTLSPLSLQNVDLDDNNVINFADVLVFQKCFSDPTCPDSKKDLNDDGTADITDLGVFYLVFGLVQGQ